jgi:UDP-N-acetylmuramate dehydrogenase
MMALNKNGLRGKLLREEPMARHTSWRVGGPAQRFYIPADVEDLAAFLRTLPPEEPIHWLGLGSNLLVRDSGVQGTVIATGGALNKIAQVSPERVRAEAGVPSAKVARFCMNHGLTGAEFLAGIPGTVGGALAMNAGAFGGEFWTLVEAVETLDRQGTRHTRPASEYGVGYRSVKMPASEWFVAAHLKLARGEHARARTLIKSLLSRRGATQPTQLPNAGSVFKNPPGDHAARLIEAAGLKGECIGGACISELHANFIVNAGRATAADIESLIEHVRVIVERRFGVRLETEVRVIGDQEDGTADERR